MSADDRPDVLVRLGVWMLAVPLRHRNKRVIIADAIDVIIGLRARVAELEAELAELRAANVEGR